MDDAAVKQFWEEQAKQHKEGDLATAPDHYYRLLEIDRILSHLRDGAKVLDVGCGNGYSTMEFAKKLPNSEFVGIDYSESMIRYAKSALAKTDLQSRIAFHAGNALLLTEHPGLSGAKFDYIVSERCLINLKNWAEQRHAILQMKALLKPGGRILLAENTQEGLERLNGLRSIFDLPAITTRWHNFYFPQAELEPFLEETFTVEKVENIGNLYYIISRVVYAKLAEMEGMEPEYSHPLNMIASKLPSLEGYQYSPNFIYVLRADC